MAERVLIKRSGDCLLPANSEALEYVRSMKPNKDYAADIMTMRNEKLHKLAFAYLKLSFDYWEPSSFVTATENRIVDALGKFLCKNGLQVSTVSVLCENFLEALERQRKGLPVEKDFDSFRNFVTIESGFFKTVITPAGPRKEAKSWAYKNMSNEEFQKLYEAIRRTCWDLVLSQTFASPEDAEQAAMNLLSFD